MQVNLPQQPPVRLLAQLKRLPFIPLESLHRRIRIMRMLQDLLIDVLHQPRRRRIDGHLLMVTMRVHLFAGCTHVVM
jgi:hypothetical protein